MERYALLTSVAVAGVLMLFLGTGCSDDEDPVNPYLGRPYNVWIVIDNDSSATRDTTLRVRTGGGNVHSMQISANSNFDGEDWQPFDSLTVYHAPHREGEFVLFARFRSVSDIQSEVVSDTIRLDFSAAIDRFGVAAPGDVLHPGDIVEFTIETGEDGDAIISFGMFINEYRLISNGNGFFNRSLSIPLGVPDFAARFRADFSDMVGNPADPVIHERVFTIESPVLNPRVISRLELPGSRCEEVWFHQFYCFISDHWETVHVVRVDDPTAPEYSHDIHLADLGFGLGANEDLLVAASHRAGSVVIRLNPPEFSSIIGRVRIAGESRDAAVRESYAYVSSMNAGLHVIDISMPNHPSEVANVRTSCHGEAVILHDTLAFVAGSGGIAVIDISNPLNPAIASEMVLNNRPRSLFYHDEKLVIANHRGGVAMLDVADPRHPQIIGEFPHLDSSYVVTCALPYMYASRGDTLSIVNLTEPRTLPFEAHIPDMHDVRGIFVRDRYLYAAERGGFAVIELFAR